MYLTIQPKADSDFAPRPYPLYINENGEIGRQDFWAKIGAVTAVGFQRDPSVQHIDVKWGEVLDDPEAVIGMYLVTSDADGQFSTHARPIGSVTRNEGELIINPRAKTTDA